MNFLHILQLTTQMVANSAVTFSDVAISYGKHEVLSEINLEVLPGEYLGLIGVNGAGKTTLINCAIEPEIMDLIKFLNKLGGNIEIVGRKIS